MLILVVSTLVLVLVALIATSSFMVIAQRRLPQLGMMSAIGATEKHLRLTMLATGAVTGVVAAVIGTVLGLGRMDRGRSERGRRRRLSLDPLNVPWWLRRRGDAARGRRRDCGGVVAGPHDVAHPHRARARRAGRRSGPRSIAPSLLAIVLPRRWCGVPRRSAARTGSASSIDLALIAVGMLAVVAGVLLVSPLAIQRSRDRCAVCPSPVGSRCVI